LKIDLGNSTSSLLATSLPEIGGELKSQISPRITFPRSGSRNTKTPPERASSLMALSFSKPTQNCYKSTGSGKPRAGHVSTKEAKRCHVIPSDSSSPCLKLRITILRAMIRRSGKNLMQKAALKLSQLE
jgi:hypothetical protein